MDAQSGLSIFCDAWFDVFGNCYRLIISHNIVSEPVNQPSDLLKSHDIIDVDVLQTGCCFNIEDLNRLYNKLILNKSTTRLRMSMKNMARDQVLNNISLTKKLWKISILNKQMNHCLTSKNWISIILIYTQLKGVDFN